ncbi:hypothetical protein BS50DRAFT_639822 [Corynespora cassiicola Philippines]|uniref:NACHT domain-containing protein n=1 Tax=Corynespora cassiicola Philippines TaxID=1448308 RepID=A0A2T2N5N7_CORCC|nr:hypothetical protein BS50DRAFT_639822 [Corynespora cassiicola Philippines]
MRKRDRVRAFFSPDTASPVPSRRASPLLAQPAPISPSSSAPSLLVSNINTVAIKSRTPAFEKALAIHLDKIPEVERAAFAHASGTIDEQNLLSGVRAYDELHKNDSSFRAHAERLSKFLGLLSRFMGGVAMGLQATPEVASLVVGAVRIVIDLALNFTIFFGKLADMICAFEDYLGPLEAYTHVADVDLVEKTVVKIYGNILDFCWKARRVFLDVNGNRRRWTSVRAFMRQHWETFESEFDSIQEDMRHHLDVLLHSVQALHYDASREAEKMRRYDEERKEKSAFLSWVSCIDFEKTHQDTYAKKHEQTCRWLIGEPEYQEWYNSPVSSLLWCYGKPGIGKSVLASSVLEHITTENELREDTAICFAYYNYRDSQLSEISQIIAALIKQLCRRRNQIPSDLLQVKQKALPASLVGTQEIFVSLVEGLSQVYVVFDALDECPEQERQDILGFITSLVTVQIPGRIKVFVTSRKEMDIVAAFQEKQIPTIQISAENVATDIENFTRSQVEKLRKGEHGKMLYITNDDLKERIIQTLSTKADGMFLWVNLQLDSLCRFSKAKKTELVEDALKALPQGLPSTYIRILERIESQIPYMKDLAQRSLAWTLYAQRPLSTEELQIVLAVKSDRENLNDLRLDSPQVILDACGNLLEENQGTIRPIHYTVQEFLSEATQGISRSLIKQQLSDSSLVHAQLGLVCLSYIQLAAFCNPVRDKLALHGRLVDNKFAAYAYKYFDYHIMQCANICQDIMVRLAEIFEQGSGYLAAIMQIKVLGDEEVLDSIWQRFNPMSIPVSASTVVYGTRLYDVPVIREKWAGGIVPKHALHFACSAGLLGAVTRLLEDGYDASEEDENSTTALYHACLEKSSEIVRQLLKHNVNIEAQGGHYGNALQAASAEGHEAIATLLLEKGANVNAEGGRYGNALQAASARGHEAIATLLLDKGANANAEGGKYGNALQAASGEGHKTIATLLLDKGANVNAEGGEYGNALQAASARGHEAIATLLLDKGANVNAEGGRYGNALQAASARGHEAIATLLLDKGADLRVTDNNGWTPLNAASNNGHLEMVKLLIEKGADLTLVRVT